MSFDRSFHRIRPRLFEVTGYMGPLKGGEGDIRLTQTKESASGSLVPAPGGLPKPAPAMLQVFSKLLWGDGCTPLRL